MILSFIGRYVGRGLLALGCAVFAASAAVAATPMIAAGSNHTVALKNDGSLWAWGSNGSGQLGLGSTTDAHSPLRIGTGTNWVSVTAGSTHTLAIKSDGTLWAWGANGNGQLGDGSGAARYAPVQVGIGTNWSAVAGGAYHSLALKSDGTLWSWGNNGSGQLGNGTLASTLAPVQVGNSTAWKSIAAGAYHNLALKADGTLWTWGWNVSGQLGIGSNTDSLVPTQVGASSIWKTIAAGYSHAVATRSDGSLWAWGANARGQLGTATTVASNAPSQVGTSSNWLFVAAGSTNSLAMRGDGSLWVWGRNDQAQLGNRSQSDGLSPMALNGDTDWLGAVIGDSHMVALKTDGTLWAWGSNLDGETGNGTNSNFGIPQQVGLAVGGKTLAVSAHAMAIGSDGTLWAWGGNSVGQFGNGTLDSSLLPVHIGSGNNWSMVAVGDSHSLALKTDGTLWAWGANSNGQLGDGTVTQAHSPIPVGVGRNDWVSIFAGYSRSYAIARDGGLWAWGSNSIGELGIGTTVEAHSPVQVGADRDWTSVAVGMVYTFALKRDGTLWAWGDNGQGQFGNGTLAGSSVPVRIGSGSNWSAIASGNNSSLGLQTDGSLWIFGGSPAMPVRVGYANNWKAISVRSGAFHAVKRDGSLWAWGDNTGGQGGVGTSGNYISTPQQVGVDTNWQAVPDGGSAVVGTKTDGSLLQWGNAIGFISFYGLPTPAPVTSPSLVSGVQVMGAGFLNLLGGVRLDVASGSGGVVTSSPAAINCGASCSVLLDQGDVLSLSAIPQRGYVFAGWAGGCNAVNGNTCTVTMAGATSVSAAFTDVQLPSTPAGLTAIALSDTQVSLAWSAASDNAAVVSYKVSRSGTVIATLGQVLATVDTGLAPGTGYSYAVQACDWAGNCSPLSAPVSVSTAGASAAGYAAFIAPGWNLLGNGFATAINVASTFGNQDAPVAGITPNVVSLWKWNAAASRWAFYSPQLNVAANASYATAHGYDLLASVNAREGYWIQTGGTLILPAQGGAKANFGFTEFSALPAGFNLLSLSQKMTPTAFNNGVAQAAPPSPSAPIQSNFTSLWAWDPAQQGWLFYAPSLEAGGGLAAVKAYALSKGYGHFQDQGRSLDLGQGFWVSK